MPRFIKQSPKRSPSHERLVKRLAQEIKNPGNGPQPLIIEEMINSTQTRHVRVIWDQWKKLSEEERTDVILEAFAQAEGPDYAGQITLASGLTAQEALVLGYLPWRVQFARTPPTNGRPEKDLRLALEEEEKKTVLGPGSIQRQGVLLFAREEDAIEACLRLREKYPAAIWSYSEELIEED